MTKTICDITGTIPASNYRITKTDGSVALTLDMCDDCAKKVIESIRSQMIVTDLQPVMQKTDTNVMKT